MKYQAQICKMIEEDNYENGCVGKAQDFGVFATVESPTLSKLIGEIECYVRLDGAEEFEGRIETQQTENDRGELAGLSELALWKENKIRLWCASYSIYIQKVEITDLEPSLLLNEMAKVAS